MSTHTAGSKPANFGEIVALEVAKGMQVRLDATRGYLMELDAENKELLEALKKIALNPSEARLVLEIAEEAIAAAEGRE